MSALPGLADTLIDGLADAAGACAVLAMVFALIGVGVVARFGRRPMPPHGRPGAVTVMKPLCGAEPGLDAALASFCLQDHPEFQIVFGVQDPADPALATVGRLRARFPRADITVVVDPTSHGMNRKVSNLINMLPLARHDTLVFADSDLHVAPDYLRRLQAELAQPGVGLVTTLYVGRPVVGGPAARLAASHLSHTFLPGALLSRALGRRDCLGSTMALARTTLDRVGGLAALSPHLADDNVLGQLVERLGLAVTLADTIPITAVQESRMAELWTHELRWARTIRALAPVAYAASALQYPTAWAALAGVLSAGASWTLALFAACWAVRAGAAAAVDRLLRPKIGGVAGRPPWWLLPLRDGLSVAEIVASYGGGEVVWRGHAMRADAGRPLALPRRDVPAGLAAPTRVAGGLLLSLLCGAAMAQQPTAAQQQAIKQACRADYQANCASVPPGGAASLACLKQNAASLSPGCSSAVLAGTGAAAKPPAAATPAAPPRKPPEQHLTLRQACGADFIRWCRGIRPVATCLRANADRLSPTCRQTLMSLSR